VEIVPPRPGHAEALYALYLATVRDVPHCAIAPDLARFRDELLGAVPTPGIFRPLRERRVMVAEEGGAARGFACLTNYRDWDDNAHRAVTALFFDDEAAGTALLAACEAAAGPGELGAFPQSHATAPVYEYNAGWDGLSDRCPRVARLLVGAGYRPFYRELHMSCDLRRFPPRPAPAPPGVELRESTHASGRLEVEALAGDESAGDCYFGTLALLSPDPRAARTGYVWGLGVAEEYQRRGLARAMMGVTLARLVALGCSVCWLTTSANNWPAQPLYLSLGFEVVDTSACYRKTLRR
jgi:ribosomal protein S18 acetylase RimI-like enzyme